MRTILRTITLIFLFVSGAYVSYAYTSPGNPSGYVNDFAHVLTPEVVQSLDQELASFEASTTNQIAVVTVKTIGSDETIESYAVKLFEEWKIGTKEKDNGVLFLVAVDDHAMRIEVGYGLEGALPDGVASSIVRNEVTPLFKTGDFNGGITQGVHAIEQATQHEYTSSSKASPSLSKVFTSNAEFLLFLIFVIGQIVVQFLARSKSWWQGGVLGVGFGILLGMFLLSWSVLAVVLLSLVLGIFGVVLDYLLSRHGPFGPHGGGGPWIVPWRGGGGRTSGGFGGFGGGSSGGGGASGNW